MSKINKRGFYWGIILYLILGLMVLLISIYFIFNEFWNGESNEREVCFQSVQLRALMPEAKKAGINWVSFKNDFALKCKTAVVDIDKGDVVDVKLAQKKIADAMVDCWALYGKGDYDVFPSKFWTTGSVCVPCARVHLSDDAKKYMETENINISIKDALNLRMSSDFSYYSYLKNSGKAFPAFSPASALEFNLDGDRFEVSKEYIPATFTNRLTGGVDDSKTWLPGYSECDIYRLNLPRSMNYRDGDLLINYGVLTSPKNGNIGDYIPYLFYFQAGQENPKPFNEVKSKKMIDGAGLENSYVCESWEGIPG